MEEHVEREEEREVDRERKQERIRALSNIIPLEQISLDKEGLYTDRDYFSATSINNCSMYNKKGPRLFALTDLLSKNEDLKQYAGLFNKNLLISENFIATNVEQSHSLPQAIKAPFTKIPHQMLAVREQNGWKFVLLSVEEAAFFKKELVKKEKSSIREIYLLSTAGELTQSGGKASNAPSQG